MESLNSSPSCKWRGTATSRPICEGAFCALAAKANKQNEYRAANVVGHLRGRRTVASPRLGERELEPERTN